MQEIVLYDAIIGFVFSCLIYSDRGPSDMWVEIIEPKSRERMFANLNTGECVWDEPDVSQLFPKICNNFSDFSFVCFLGGAN